MLWKILLLLPILVSLLAACSSNTAKNDEGKWQSEDGVVMTIKGESLKVKEQDVEFEGSIKNDEKHKDLTVFKINGSIGYIKVDNDMKRYDLWFRKT